MLDHGALHSNVCSDAVYSTIFRLRNETPLMALLLASEGEELQNSYDIYRAKFVNGNSPTKLSTLTELMLLKRQALGNYGLLS